MATILFDQHATTTASTIGRMERVLSTRHSLILVPSYNPSSEDWLRTWVSRNAMGVDLFVGCDYRIVRCMRRKGWRGHVLWTAHADLPHGASGLRTVLPFLWKTDVIWVASRADKEIYESLVAQDGAQPEVVYLPYGIDFDTSSPLVDQADRQRLRQEWGIAPEDYVVIYAGRILPQKNVHSAIEVIYHLSLLCPNIRFVIAGRFEELPFREFGLWVQDIQTKVNYLIEELHIAEHVRFVGWLDKIRMKELYRIGDTLMNLTLDTDNFGNAQIEAMGAGLPVIGTAWGALKDTIIEGQTGFLADTWISEYGIRFDMPKVVNSLQLLSVQPALRNMIGIYAAQYATSQYSMTAYRERLIEMIDALLSVAPMPSTARFANLGVSLQARFATVDQYTGDEVALFPAFSRLSDPQWTQLIRPYSSLGWLDPSSGNRMFTALRGGIQGEFYYSTDLLWPIRIRVDHQEAKGLNQLTRYPCANRQALDCPDDTIRTLVRKGLAGISN